MAHVLGVDPDHAGLERIGNAQGAAGVVGPHIPGEAIAHRVGDGHCLGFALKGDHRQHRSKDFLLGNAHAVGGAGEQGRFDIVAAARALVQRTAGGDLGTVVPGDVKIRTHLGEVALVDQRPDVSGRVERVPDLHAPCALGNARGEYRAASTSRREFAVQRSPLKL